LNVPDVLELDAALEFKSQNLQANDIQTTLEGAFQISMLRLDWNLTPLSAVHSILKVTSEANPSHE
jgi:DNA recombination-dependent growth factor C